MTTDESTMIAPTDRSKPPAMITNVIAEAMIASGAFWFRMLSRLRTVRKLSDIMDSTTTSTTTMMSTA